MDIDVRVVRIQGRDYLVPVFHLPKPTYEGEAQTNSPYHYGGSPVSSMTWLRHVSDILSLGTSG